MKLDDTQLEKFVKLYGGSQLDKARDFLFTDENFVIIGEMNTTDKGLQACFICTDEYGNQKSWSPILIGDGLNDTGNAVFKTSDGNYILVGTKSITSTNTDLLAAKISPSGSIIWTKSFGGALKEEGFFGIELSQGGYIVGGYTESFGSGKKDIYMLRLNADGIESWLNPSIIGGPEDEIGYGVVEMENYLYVIGATNSYGVAHKNIYVVQVNPYRSDNIPAGINYHYWETSIPYDGLKINVLPGNKLLIMGSNSANSTYLECISGDLNNSYWDKEIISATNENYTDLFFTNNSIYLFGSTNVNSNTDIIIRFLNNVGNDIKTRIIPSDGIQNSVSGLIVGQKIVISGTNTINDHSQIFLLKDDL